MGAEADATWIVDQSGQEAAYCCLGATLRDYGRLGLLLANDGVAGGKQVVPREWIREATQPTPGYPHLRPGVAEPYSAMDISSGCSRANIAGSRCSASAASRSSSTRS